MQKIVYSTKDILDDFMSKACLKGLSEYQIDSTIATIVKDNYQLVRIVSTCGGYRSVLMCFWNEGLLRDSDEWTRPIDRFVSAFSDGYIREAIRY